MMGRGWNYINNYSNTLYTLVKDFADQVNSDPTELCNINPNKFLGTKEERENSNPLMEVINEFAKIPEWKDYGFLVVIAIGEPALLLEFAEENKICQENNINIMKAFIRVVQITDESFKKLVNAPQELAKYEDILAKNLISPIIQYSQRGLEVCINSYFFRKYLLII